MTASGIRRIWDQREADARHLEYVTGQARALELSQDPAELEAIAAGNVTVIAAVLERPIGLTPLGEYLADVEKFLRRYVAFPSDHEPTAIALWIAHAHLVDQFETSPILAITSAEMRSGKTRVQELLELLVPHPFRVVMPSEAVVYTVLAQRPRPTMLLDEADAIFSPRMAERYEGLRAILNAGNRQGNPVLRVKLDGKRREVESFDVFGPKCIAGIGQLPTTVADRAIPIRLKRRAPGELVARFRERQARIEASAIRFPSFAEAIRTDVPVPDELNDRAADSWEPLLALADSAGADWPARGRLAALALSGTEQDDLSTGMRLLADIRDAFDELKADHLGTVSLLDWLHDLDEAPWGEWYGKPLTARGLARLLDPYRVRPLNRRLAGRMTRGYFRSEFEDAWQRYVPAPASVASVASVAEGANATDETDATGQQEETEDELMEQAAPWRFGQLPEPDGEERLR